MPYEMFLTMQLMHFTCRKDRIHNDLQEKKDDTCSKEQVTTDKEEYDDTFKESKRPQTQWSYVTLLSNIIDAEPSSYEVAKKKGKETMIKEYQFKKNDV